MGVSAPNYATVDFGANTLESVLGSMLADYINEQEEVAAKAAHGAALLTARKIRSAGHRRSGRYNRGWRVRDEAGADRKRASVAYQSRVPGLPHLIEKGHGGPHPAPAHPHIEPAYELGREEFLRLLGR